MSVVNTPAAQNERPTHADQGTVPPGATYDIFVDLVSPAQPGLSGDSGRYATMPDRCCLAHVWVGIIGRRRGHADTDTGHSPFGRYSVLVRSHQNQAR